MNTTLRCAANVIFQAIVNASAITVFYPFIFVFAEFAMYTKACTLDIKSLFDRIDRLLDCEKWHESRLLDYCEEAIELHIRVNR